MELIRSLAALACATCVVAPAFAETVVVSCQPDRVTGASGVETLSDAAKTAGVWRSVFAYDLESGKACIADPTSKICMTNHKVEMEPSKAIKLSAATYDRRFDLTLITPTGRFSRSNGANTQSGKDGSCTLMTGVTVDLNRRPDPFS